MRRDSELVLKKALEKREREKSDSLRMETNELSDIPNIGASIEDILDDLKCNNCVSSNSAYYIDGSIYLELTLDGMEHFDRPKSNDNNRANVTIMNFEGNNNTGIANNENHYVQNNYYHTINYEEIENLLQEINSHISEHEKDFGDKYQLIKNKIDELEELVNKKNNPNATKIVLTELKDIFNGMAGSLIAQGIVTVISNILQNK